jgi:hypothetical protein
VQFDVDNAATAAPDQSGLRGPSVIDLDSPGAREAFAAVNVFESLSIRPAGDSEWSMFLRFTDGRPALLVRDLAAGADPTSLGAGRLVLFTSSLDPSWCDLPYRPAMVPLLHDTLLWLVEPRLVSRTIAPREVWERHLAGELAGLKITMPDDSTLDVAGFVEPVGTPKGALLAFGRTERPGVYRLTASDAAGGRLLDALGAVAVNVHADESDQTIWSAAELESLFPGDRCEVVPPDAAINAALIAGLSAREVWPLAAALLAALLLAETLLAYRFSFQAKSRETSPQVARKFAGARRAA